MSVKQHTKVKERFKKQDKKSMQKQIYSPKSAFVDQNQPVTLKNETGHKPTENA